MTFNEVMRSFEYEQGGALLLIVVVTVSVLDIISQRIRARFI
jgi:phosphonate transport system permease protein